MITLSGGSDYILSDSINTTIKSGTGTGLNLDAWGTQKVSIDKSILHGMFTHEIPEAVWREVVNGTETTSRTNVASVNGKMVLSSGDTLNDYSVLDTYRNPRYQPNRGHHYSASIMLPSTTALGERDFGMFTEEAGVFYRLKSDGNLYACRRTTIDSITTDTEELITIPFEIDLEKGNIYDIQMQWRGVGNIKFYIGNASNGTLEWVHTMSLLNTLEELSIYNPAMPLAFKSTNLGDNVQIVSGCVDVSSENGEQSGKIYGSLSMENNSGQVAISGYNQPVLIVKSEDLFTGMRNTRDIQVLSATAYADQKSFFRVYTTRDTTAITLNDQSWSSYRDGNISYIQYDDTAATPVAFDTSKATLLFGTRVDQDQSFTALLGTDSDLDVFQTPGQILIFTMHRESGLAVNVGVTYEFAEEI